jgi:hypothetical protein
MQRKRKIQKTLLSFAFPWKNGGFDPVLKKMLLFYFSMHFQKCSFDLERENK